MIFGPPKIDLTEVEKEFDRGKVPALRGISLSFFPGELVAVYGASGSGKSTLVNMLTGMDQPTSGSIALDGVRSPRTDQWADFRRNRIGIVFQDFNLIPILSAAENVELPLLGLGIPASERRHVVRDRLAEVGANHFAKRRPTQLSGGERRRVSIARSLVNNPGLICADEPTSNLDSASGEQIAELLISIHSNRGTTMVVVTHDEKLIARCPRKICLKDGLVVSDIYIE